ncbi:MAG: ATP-binding cassette domain-containing protein [Acidobacteriota bacterium]|nr:ATP-binding cassette domain-containing protein [Acidobacteriota bacterium]
MSETAPVLEFRISARYGATAVLNEVAAAIGPGEIVALVGLSGSGKSTLALSLLRLLHYRDGAVSGSIRLEGEEIVGLSERAMRSLRGRRIGYVPQSPAVALNEKIRVRTLLDETWRAHKSGRPSASFYGRLLERVRLPGDAAFLARRAGELSTGQGQRLLIALAIMHEPALVIADEPTSALDAITHAAVLSLFVELNQTLGTALLFISHDLLSVAAISHRVEILHEGRIVESGAPAAIFRNPQDPFTRRLVDAMPRNPH